MPNVKFFIDETRYPQVRQILAALLPDLRKLFCAALSVEPSACQIAVIPVLALPDQPQINAELHILPNPGRTPALIRQLAGDLRARLHEATGLSVAVRIATLDPTTYVALK